MALDAPTNFAAGKRFHQFDDAFWRGLFRIGMDFRPRRVVALPEWQERVVELRWEEQEAGDCVYEVVLDRAGENIQVATVSKGTGATLVVTARRETDREASRMRPWDEFVGTFSVRAKSTSDESSWVDLVLEDDPDDQELTVPQVDWDFGAAGAGVGIDDASQGHFGHMVTVHRHPQVRSSVLLATRAPRDSAVIPHAPRAFAGRDEVIETLRTRFANSTTYYFRAQPLGVRITEFTSGKLRYHRAEIFTGPSSHGPVDWSGVPTALVVDSFTVRPYVGISERVQLQANKQVEWEIVGDAPAWVSLEGSELEISPPSTQQQTVTVKATDEVPTEVEAKIVIHPRSLPAPPVVRMSASVLNNGFVYEQGEAILIQPTAQGAVEWQALLPDGLTLNSTNGYVSGAVLEPGRYNVSIQARGEISDWSAPLEIPLKIIRSRFGADLAGVRFPWLVAEWKFTDLQVDLVTRAVSSSRLVSRTPGATDSIAVSAERQKLLLKPRDTTHFAVLFLRGNEAPALAGIERLRIGVRPLNNIDDPFWFESDGSPVGVEAEGATYYAISGKLSDAAEEALIDKLFATGENQPVAAIGDVEWQINGDLYTSQTFQIDLELDITRDD